MNGDYKFYQLGYEAAMHAKYRCMEYDQILSEMQADLEEIQSMHPNINLEKPFAKGFERGIADCQKDCAKSTPAARQGQADEPNP